MLWNVLNIFFELIIPAAVLLSFLAAVLFVLLQLIQSFLSNRYRAFKEKHPLIYALWMAYSFLWLLVFLIPIWWNWWPPLSIEHQMQKAKIQERIQAAGGWAVLQKECDEIVAQHSQDQTGYFGSGIFHSEVKLPPSIAALKPIEVRFDSYHLMQREEFRIPVVHIQVFGLHRTGGHSEPYFTIDVISGHDLTGYPPPRPEWLNPVFKDVYVKITDTIYEHYYDLKEGAE